MALDAILRAAVAKARTITSALQVTVRHTPFTGRTKTGVATYGTATTYQALVNRQRKVFQGVIAQGTVTFLEPVTLSLDDLLTLPGGDVVTILGANQSLDPAGGAYMTEIWMGASPTQTGV
jgi:hypothetical protein